MSDEEEGIPSVALILNQVGIVCYGDAILRAVDVDLKYLRKIETTKKYERQLVSGLASYLKYLKYDRTRGSRNTGIECVDRSKMKSTKVF